MSKAETAALVALRSVVKLMWPRAVLTVATADAAAIFGLSPTETSRRCSPSGTIRIVVHKTVFTVRARRCTAPVLTI